jgi:hypothetical protein
MELTFICVSLDGAVRYVNVMDIAAVEDEGEKTIIYLKNNNSVHIACDQDIENVMEMIFA